MDFVAGEKSNLLIDDKSVVNVHSERAQSIDHSVFPIYEEYRLYDGKQNYIVDQNQYANLVKYSTTSL
jgi:hypothetical protein